MPRSDRTGSRLRIALQTALAAIVLSASMAVIPAATAADAGGVAWSVQTADNANGAGRPNFTYDVEPGETITDSMIVTNTGTIELPLDVYAADAFTTISGNIDILPAGTASTDAGAWVAPAIESVTLAPGETADIAFTITVPADASPGDHAAGLVTSLTSQDATQSIEVDRRLGTRINLRVAGEFVPAASVAVLATEAVPSLNPLAPTTVRIIYRVENTGNTRVTGSEAVVAHTVAGLLATRTVEPQLPEILPRSAIEIVREVPVTSLGWVGGTLTIAAEGVGLGAGSIDPIVVEFGAVAIPWSLLVVIVLAAGGTIGVILWTRSAGHRRAADGTVADPEPADV